MLRIYRIPLRGGKIENVTQEEAWQDATDGIKWVYTGADEMFAKVPVTDGQFKDHPRQSKRYLFCADKDILIRNAERLGIHYEE